MINLLEEESMTVEEFLSSPDIHPKSEYLNGRVDEFVVNSNSHVNIQVRLILILGGLLELKHPSFQLKGETFGIKTAGNRIYMPDITVIPAGGDHELSIPYEGGIEFAAEILSRHSVYKDTRVKYLDYLKHGVKEYWIVNPDIRIIDVYLLEDGKYVSRNFVAGEIIDAGMFAADGIPVDLIYDRTLSVIEFMNHQRNT